MHHITLIKTCNEIQLAHIYEHIYLLTLVEFCNEHHLLSYIDYRWYGETSHGGFIYISIVLITPKARAFSMALRELSPAFSQELIDGAMSEIIAEKKKRMGGNNALLHKGLRELHAKPWQTVEEFGSFDAYGSRRSRNIVWGSDMLARTKLLKCELILENEFALNQRRLLPLFHILAIALGSNMTQELEIGYHFYGYDDSSVYTRRIAKVVNRLRIVNVGTVHLTDALTICTSTARHVSQQDFIGRLAAFLQESMYRKELVGPDELAVYEACGVLVGDSGWRTIGTKENISNILKHTTLQLVYGREKQALALADLFV